MTRFPSPFPALPSRGPFSILLLAILAVAACSPSQEDASAEVNGPAEIEPGATVAVDRLGPITLEEIDAFLLQQSADRRWSPDQDPREQYARVARRLAVHRLLLDEAQLTGADQDPELQRRERTMLRDAHVAQWLNRQSAAAPDRFGPPSEEAVRAFYQENLDQFRTGERREVFHLFRRWSDDGGRDAVLEEIDALRERFLAGESMENLCREYSHSETRFQDGRLGFVPRGHFPPDFDRVVFSVETGEPSEIVKTADGAHFFLVKSVLEEQELSFEDVRRKLFARLVDERREALWADAIRDLEKPENAFAATPEALAQAFAAGDPSILVAQAGDWNLTAGALREAILTAASDQGTQMPAFPALQNLYRSELVFQHLQSEGLPDLPDERLEHARLRQLTEHYAKRKMRTFLERDPERIRRHYDNHRMRFAEPAKVRVRRLVLPQGEVPPRRMQELEEARAALDAGETTLESLADAYEGASLRDLGLVAPAQLRRIDREAPRFAFVLEPGEHSPPYRSQKNFVLFQVTERIEPKPRPFSQVRERVVQDVIAQSAAEVFRELSQEILGDAEFRYVDPFTAPSAEL